MEKLVVFGYCFNGCMAYLELEKNVDVQMMGFVDNSILKQGNYAFGTKIMSMTELESLNKKEHVGVIIAANAYKEIATTLEQRNIEIKGIYFNGKIEKYNPIGFEKLDFTKKVFLYAGDICDEVHMQNTNLYGLSINKSDERHIYHDITKPYPLPDNCVDGYQAEDVLEHIELEKIVQTINEIYRILKPNTVFRICLPDYYSPRLKKISMKTKNGDILFDPTGGGGYGEFGVKNGGHLWFPNYKLMMEILEQTMFKRYEFLCYYDENEVMHKKNIDVSYGYINRISEDKIENNDEIYSMVIDAWKE